MPCSPEIKDGLKMDPDKLGKKRAQNSVVQWINWGKLWNSLKDGQNIAWIWAIPIPGIAWIWGCFCPSFREYVSLESGIPSIQISLCMIYSGFEGIIFTNNTRMWKRKTVLYEMKMNLSRCFIYRRFAQISWLICHTLGTRIKTLRPILYLVMICIGNGSIKSICMF